MKKRYIPIIILIAWLPMLIAAWDATKPVGSEAVRDGDNDIRSNNAAIEAALGANHEFSTGGTNSGKHTTIVMEEQASITTATNEMGLYCADLGTAPGLYLRPQSDGTAIQWSDISAKIVNAAMAADSIDSAQYVDGSIDAVHLAADVIDETKIADDGIDSEHYNDGSIDAVHLATDVIDETKIADDGIDSEHYNDGSIDAVHIANIDPDNYAGGETTTFANGLIVKMGYKVYSGATETITFGTAFPTAAISANVTTKFTATTTLGVAITGLTTTQLTFKPVGAVTGNYWIAIGY